MASGGNFACGECGQFVNGLDYHPHLYCVLWKAGIRDQAAYLAAAGWERIGEVVRDG
jgi:hypothetical protein